MEVQRYTYGDEPRTIYKVYHNGKYRQKSAPKMGAIYNDSAS